MRHKSVAVTGRFQPFHRDHLDLALQAAGLADTVTIGITNPDIHSLTPDPASTHRHKAAANPFTYSERRVIIEQALLAAGFSESAFTIVAFPLDDPSVWGEIIPLSVLQLVRTFAKWEYRKVELLRMGGYDVRTIAGDTNNRISASDIRAAMAEGSDWQHWLPPGAIEVMTAFGDAQLARRCRQPDSTT